MNSLIAFKCTCASVTKISNNTGSIGSSSGSAGNSSERVGISCMASAASTGCSSDANAKSDRLSPLETCSALAISSSISCP